MTNFEYIQSHDCEEVSRLLCVMVETEFYKIHGDTLEHHCDSCPMDDRCTYKHNGWMDWLMEEKK